MVSHETTVAQQFRLALAAESDDPGPDDPTPGAALARRPVVVQAVGKDYPVAPGYTVYAVRLAVVDGEEVVETGAAVGRRVGRPEVARALAEEADPAPWPWATHLVVNDHLGDEWYRRPLRAA